ncbi:MAG: carboxylating nicotinate-nucleotide diphosphorylase [Bdellovibrionales bacterium]
MTPNLTKIISTAFEEDLPRGDVTTDSLRLPKTEGSARLLAKEDLVLAGRDVFAECVAHIEPEAQISWQFKDGELVLGGQTAAWIKGNLVGLLKAERVALNFLGRLSGIATLTRCFVQETRGTKCQILDTRKTTPLWRSLEKMAVKCGGGVNHRMNLSDAILIKENHIRAARGLTEAVQRIRKNFSGPIEVECATLEEVEKAVQLQVNRILLDNMTNDQIRQARERIPTLIQVEASGNMKLERIRSVAELGVDFISVGALTHSAPVADFSLLFEWPETNSPATGENA